MPTELDKLEQYLRCNHYVFERHLVYDNCGLIIRNQLIVFNKRGIRQWDAICQYGSMGFTDRLIEIMGEPVVNPDEDDGKVVGYLTAQEVIKRLIEK